MTEAISRYRPTEQWAPWSVSLRRRLPARGAGGGTAQNQGQHEDGRSRREPSSDLPRAQSTANTEAPFGFWDDDHGTSQGSGG